MKIVEVVTLEELGEPAVTRLNEPIGGPYVKPERTSTPPAIVRLMKESGLKYHEAAALVAQRRQASKLARQLLSKQPKAKKKRNRKTPTTLEPGRRKVRKSGPLKHGTRAK